MNQLVSKLIGVISDSYPNTHTIQVSYQVYTQSNVKYYVATAAGLDLNRRIHLGCRRNLSICVLLIWLGTNSLFGHHKMMEKKYMSHTENLSAYAAGQNFLNTITFSEG